MDDDLRDAIGRVGDRVDLGEYEVEAYLAVLEHGELTASELAERTEVPQPRIYDTVRSLADRGLVELRESRPMRVVAVDPEEAFAETRTSLDALVDELGTRYTTPARGAEAASLVKSRSTILRHVEEVLTSAEYELSVSLTPALLDRYESDLAAAVEDGVTVDLLVTPAGEAPDPESFDYDSVATVARARRGVTTPILAVADGEPSVYTTQDGLRDDGDRYAVVFDRSALGFLVSGFFDTVLWTTADPLASTDRAPTFPRQYASIRRAVKDLDGLAGEVYASVVGRDVETGEQVVVEGQVVAVDSDPSEQVATLTVEEADGRVTVGGRLAAYEDVEGWEFRVARDGVPTRT
ncbi:MAG: HTH-type sugar sensing transcriptional regulator TrmB [Haloplanus sp.]